MICRLIIATSCKCETTDRPTFVEVQLCPYCDFSTHHQAQLTRHLRKAHKVSLQNCQFIPLRDALAGQPQCTHCGTKLSKRSGLQRHIVSNNCAFFDENRSLCGLRHFSRKTLVEHLHRDHAHAWNIAQPFVATLAAQISNSPCAACGHEGKRAHACPVIRQVALIHPQLGSQLTSPSKRARHQESAGKSTSRPIANTFQPARDAADGEPQCAHCGMASKTMYILRRRIEDGYCKKFDAHRAMGGHIPSTWPWLLRQAADNPIRDILHSETTKATLCSHCVLCGQHLQRSGAVLPHIQNDHGLALDRALKTYPDLLRQLQAKAKCHCIHPVAQPEHRCPVHHQIILIAASHETARPWQAADFSAIWEDPDQRASLTQTCSICKLQCGNNALLEHLHTHDALSTEAAALLPLAQSPFMDCCEFCLQASEPPEHCPVALNLCAHLLSHGPRSAPDDGGGSLWGHRRDLGQPSPCQETSSNRDLRATTSPTATTADSSLIELALRHESQLQALAMEDQFICFLQSDPRGILPILYQGTKNWKNVQMTKADNHGTDDPPMAASHPGTLGTPGQSDEGRPDGSTVARTPDCTSPESPRRMAIHAVRYGEEETLSPRATTDPYGQDEGVDPRTTRTGSEPESDLEVQSPEAAIHQPAESTNLPVAAAGDRTQQPVVGAAPFSQSLKSLALAVLPGPTTPIEIQPLGRTIGPPVARTIEKSAAARACLTLRLQNDGVICYVNANLSAFLWGMLQRQSADWADFSGQEKAFQSLLTKGQYNAFALETPGFEGLTGAWGSFHRQEDGHEFTHTLLSWCRPACMDLTWSRRYVAKGNVLTYDHGSTDMPPTLTVGACEKGASSLQRLISAWNNHCGMKTCFHHAHELLCLHLDRLTRNDSGEVCRAAWQIEIEAEVRVPFWMTDDNMAPFSQEYVPVAVIFHNGSI